MKKIFNYNKFNDETLDSLVEAFGSLSDAYASGKANTGEYKEANKRFNEDFMRECASAMPTYDAEKFSMEDFKNPMVHKNIFMLQKFDTILAQMITPVLPKIIAEGYEGLYDVTQVGWGDNAKFEVKSNELFVVNDAAIGIARGGVLTKYNTEYTIQASKKEIGVYCDWYHVAAFLY